VLALGRSLLNGEYILLSVLKALPSIISVCGLSAVLLSGIVPRYFALFTGGMFGMGRRLDGLFRWVGCTP
jgi:hypothetical protein